MSPSFFLCYRREDAGYAAALSGALIERHGRGQVFKDITSLRLAQDWRTEVVSALNRSPHVLVLVGHRWMAGVDRNGESGGRPDPVVFEVTEAFRRRLVVVPVLVGGAPMPQAHLLPSALARFADLNAAHIRTESADADIADLVRKLPQPAPPVRPLTPPRPAPARVPQPRTRTGWYGWLIGALVLAAAAYGVVLLVGLITSSIGAGGLGSPTSPSGNKPLLVINPTRGPAGTQLTCTATGFTPGSTVKFLFQAQPLVDVDADANGRATATFTVPGGPSTTLTVTAVQQSSVLYDDALFERTG